MIRKVCSVCGGEDIHVSAWVVWSIEKQEYVIEDFWESETWCEDCQDTVAAIEKEDP